MTALLNPNLFPKYPIDRLVTGEELLQHPEWGPCELVRGKVVPVCRPNSTHGRLVVRLASKIDTFVDEHNLGMAFSGDSGVYIQRDPDTLRGPDIHFVRTENCPQGDALNGYLNIAPDLCIEIVSPSDQWTKLEEKVAEYLKSGVKLIWVIDPATRSARIYHADGNSNRITETDSLAGEDVLPGFELKLTELFSALEIKIKRPQVPDVQME